MKLSIILSTYNGSHFIKEQLDSIRNQTRLPDEVLIYDDGSSDNTVEIVESYIENYNLKDKWTLKINTKNLGWKRNFQNGILACSGELIFPCDQDDIWNLNKLEEMSEVMYHHPEISVLASYYTELYENRHEKIVFFDNNGETYSANCIDRIFNVPYPGCTFCVRQSFLTEVEMYWENFAHDAFLWRFAIFNDSAYVLKKALIKWRKYSTSTFQLDNRKDRNYQGKMEWLAYAEDFLKCLKDYTVNNSKVQSKEVKVHKLEQYEQWVLIRRQFFLTRNPIYGIKLIRYLNFYSRNRQFIGDWVITYIWERGD